MKTVVSIKFPVLRTADLPSPSFAQARRAPVRYMLAEPQSGAQRTLEHRLERVPVTPGKSVEMTGLRRPDKSSLGPRHWRLDARTSDHFQTVSAVFQYVVTRIVLAKKLDYVVQLLERRSRRKQPLVKNGSGSPAAAKPKHGCIMANAEQCASHCFGEVGLREPGALPALVQATATTALLIRARRELGC